MGSKHEPVSCLSFSLRRKHYSNVQDRTAAVLSETTSMWSAYERRTRFPSVCRACPPLSLSFRIRRVQQSFSFARSRTPLALAPRRLYRSLYIWLIAISIGWQIIFVHTLVHCYSSMNRTRSRRWSHVVEPRHTDAVMKVIPMPRGLIILTQ